MCQGRQTVFRARRAWLSSSGARKSVLQERTGTTWWNKVVGGEQQRWTEIRGRNKPICALLHSPLSREHVPDRSLLHSLPPPPPHILSWLIWCCLKSSTWFTLLKRSWSLPAWLWLQREAQRDAGYGNLALVSLSDDSRSESWTWERINIGLGFTRRVCCCHTSLEMWERINARGWDSLRALTAACHPQGAAGPGHQGMWGRGVLQGLRLARRAQGKSPCSRWPPGLLVKCLIRNPPRWMAEGWFNLQNTTRWPTVASVWSRGIQPLLVGLVQVRVSWKTVAIPQILSHPRDQAP